MRVLAYWGIDLSDKENAMFIWHCIPATNLAKVQDVGKYFGTHSYMVGSLKEAEVAITAFGDEVLPQVLGKAVVTDSEANAFLEYEALKVLRAYDDALLPTEEVLAVLRGQGLLGANADHVEAARATFLQDLEEEAYYASRVIYEITGMPTPSGYLGRKAAGERRTDYNNHG